MIIAAPINKNVSPQGGLSTRKDPAGGGKETGSASRSLVLGVLGGLERSGRENIPNCSRKERQVRKGPASGGKETGSTGRSLVLGVLGELERSGREIMYFSVNKGIL